MITTNRTYKYARLDARILSIDDFYIGWRQYVRGDDALVNLGTLFFKNGILKDGASYLKI